MDEVAANFAAFTGANENAARHVLDMCDADLERALQLWFEDEELQRNLGGAASAPLIPATSSADQPTARARRHATDRQDPRVIDLVSDDDDDDVVGGVEEVVHIPRRDVDDEATAAIQAAAEAQAEEDAAMAKRLQEELYSASGGGGGSSAADVDGVRAIIPGTTGTLIAPSGDYEDRHDMDVHDMDVLEQFRRQQRTLASSRNPFAQSIWDDRNTSGSAAPAASGTTNNNRHLAELFRPPYDLMTYLPWDDAREKGKEQKKWLLVNLQNMAIFNCHMLNRDIWKDDEISKLVHENFIFLQYDLKTPQQAEQYIAFYFTEDVHKNSDIFPHASIVDPRTGEQVKVWSGDPFPERREFHAQLVDFLDRYSLDANSKNPVVETKRPRVLDVDRMTEDDMLELAMQESLETSGGASQPDVHDLDELAKRTRESKGKDVEKAEEGLTRSPQAVAFANIPSDQPHEEPVANNSATRIQFRHPEGRVIRRFALDDPVRRIYEWLKAAPLEGREGVEFELKVTGKDLISDLNKHISEAGLQNGTVMIEFITE